MRKHKIGKMTGLETEDAGERGSGGARGGAGGWQTKLALLLGNHNDRKSNGIGNTSHQTKDQRGESLFRIFKLLRDELKFGIEDPANLREKHIEALMSYWVAHGYSAGTIDNYLSYLRTLCKWMGKTGMVKTREEYAPGLVRPYAAQNDKSFTGNGVDFWEAFDKVAAMDVHVAEQILVIKAFGLRRKEVVMLKPLIADRGLYLEVFDGTKGGRPRTVPIDSDFRRAVIARAKNFVLIKTGSAKGHLGHPDKNLAQNLKRYSYVMGACGYTKVDEGVTGHGLRAEYAMDELMKRGVVPTILGGSGRAKSQLETDLAYLQVSEQLGHSRKSVMPAYAGALIVVEIPGGDRKNPLIPTVGEVATNSQCGISTTAAPGMHRDDATAGDPHESDVDDAAAPMSTVTNRDGIYHCGDHAT